MDIYNYMMVVSMEDSHIAEEKVESVVVSNDGWLKRTGEWANRRYYSTPQYTYDGYVHKLVLASETPIADYKKVLGEALYEALLKEWENVSKQYMSKLDTVNKLMKGEV